MDDDVTFLRFVEFQAVLKESFFTKVYSNINIDMTKECSVKNSWEIKTGF